MGMNLAGGYQKVQRDSVALGISAADKIKADHSLAGWFNAQVSDTKAEVLGACSKKTGRPDGMGMKLSGGFQKVQEDAAALHISVADKVQADRWVSACVGIETAALDSRGKSIPNRGVTARNADGLGLGEEIGSAVMGRNGRNTLLPSPNSYSRRTSPSHPT